MLGDLCYINYGIEIWGSTYATYLSKVFKLQKRIARIIAGVPPRTDCAPLFTRLGILTLDKLYKYHIGLFMYKYHNYMLPTVFNMFTRNSVVHSYYTRQHNLMHVPYFRTELGKKSFNYQAVIVWNYIFQNMDANIGIGTFKYRLKHLLLA